MQNSLKHIVGLIEAVIIVAIWLVVLSVRLTAQPVYSLLYEPSWSQIAGAENLLTLHRAVVEVQGKFLPAQLFDESSDWTKAAGIAYRLSKAILLDNNIEYLPMILQHEVFGHGARFREFGFQGSSYNINLGPPYGNASGFAVWGRNKRSLTETEDIAAVIGGVEANQRMAQTTFLQWLQRGHMHYREMLTALLSMHDITLYTLTTTLGDNADIDSYRFKLNTFYRNRNIDKTVRLEDIQRQVLLNLLNPWQYFIAYSYAKEYTWDAKEEWAFPMIRFGEVGYVPSLRCGLGVFGVEGYIENFLSYAGASGLVYYRQTLDSPLPAYGVGMEVRNVSINSWLTLGMKCDAWLQSTMRLGTEDRISEETRPGISATALANVWLPEQNGYRVGLTLHAGYKTRGFVQSEPLDQGAIIRVGIGFVQALKNDTK